MEIKRKLQKKSIILIFHKRKINSKFTFNKHELDISTSYEYLGITFQRYGSFRTATQVLSRKATKAYYSLMKTFSNTKGTPVRVQVHLFDYMIKLILGFKTSSFGPKCELGRYPLMLNVIQYITKCVTNVISKPCQSLSYLAPHRGRARYCNAHVCLFVCLCVCVFVCVFVCLSVFSQNFKV